MILRVPAYKKLNLGQKGDNLFINTINENTNPLKIEELNSTVVPKVVQWLNYYGVLNYTIKIVDSEVLVDIDGNLYLSNKNLTTIKLFKFDKVTGSCNMSGNNFTDFTYFPRFIGKDCIANFNYISDFTNAPVEIRGLLLAKKQKSGTIRKYILSDENYRKYLEGTLNENYVYIVNEDAYGEIMSIDEELGLCKVLLVENEEVKTYKTNEVDCLESVQNLLLK